MSEATKYETYEAFCEAMIVAAKDIQGDNYAGDDYYTQPCWMEYWEDGDDPREAVESDMEYWDQ